MRRTSPALVVLQRVGFFVLTLWTILTISFLCVYTLPGDPARLILGQRASTQTVQAFRLAARLDSPLAIQYGNFLVRTMRGNFGESLAQRRPVAALVRERAGTTVLLVALSFALMAFLSVGLPILFAIVGSPWWTRTLDRVLTLFAVAPSYVLGVVAVGLFSGILGWVPAVFDATRPGCWVLPVFVLSIYPAALLARVFHRALERNSHSLSVKRARALGFSNSDVFWNEVLRVSLSAPLATLVQGIAFFVTGTFFVESVFGIAGLGGLAYEAVRNKDVALLVPLCLVFGTAVSILSVGLDMGLRLADPRSRSQHA